MENLLQAIDYAMNDNVADMQDEILLSLKEKIAEKIQEKRIEVAKSILTNESVSHKSSSDINAKIEQYVKQFIASDDPSLKGKSKQERYNIAMTRLNKFIENYARSDDPQLKKLSPEQRIEYAVDKFLSQNMNEQYIEEKITKSTPVKEIVRDFVNSDDPKLKGKSREDRIRMALAVYYNLHPEERKNIKEDLPEIPKTNPTKMSVPSFQKPKMEFTQPKFRKIKSSTEPYAPKF